MILILIAIICEIFLVRELIRMKKRPRVDEIVQEYWNQRMIDEHKAFLMRADFYQTK